MGKANIENEASSGISTPTSGRTVVSVDTVTKKLYSKDDAGVVTNYDDPTAVDHNDTDNIQGGTTAEYYHLTQNQHDGLANLPDFHNGTFVESFNALVTSNGSVITLSLEKNGGGDLTTQFSSGTATLDCTPAKTITLDVGTVSTPKENYIYILESAPTTLVKSTSTWPALEHIKIGFFFVQTAAYVQADGALINQNWNDHVIETNDMGHLTAIGRWIREQPPKYKSGVDAAGDSSTYIVTTVGPDRVSFKCGSGQVSQMHLHTFGAKDTTVAGGDDIHVINDYTTPYVQVSNLLDILNDSTGVAIGNNKYFNLMFAGVANKGGEYSPILCNVPSGTYSSLADAQNDVAGYDELSLPAQFIRESGTGFAITRITFKRVGTTWVYQSANDLRGTTPTQVSGGGAGGSITSFNDDNFQIYNNADNTKIVDVDASGITTGTTRTLTAPDKDGTIAVTSEIVPISTVTASGDLIIADGNASVTNLATPTIAAGDGDMVLTLTDDDDTVGWEKHQGNTADLRYVPTQTTDIDYATDHVLVAVYASGDSTFSFTEPNDYFTTTGRGKMFAFKNATDDQTLIVKLDGTSTFQNGLNEVKVPPRDVLNMGVVRANVADGYFLMQNLHADAQVRYNSTWTASSWTSATACPFDTTDGESDTNIIEHDNSNVSRVNLKILGNYYITYWFSVDSTGGSSWQATAYLRLNGTTTIPGSTMIFGNYQTEDTGTCLGPIEIETTAATDYIELIMDNNSLTGNANNIVMTVTGKV